MKTRYQSYLLTIAILFYSTTMHIRANTNAHLFSNVKMKVEKLLIEKYGDLQKERIKRGINQVLLFWQKDDGNEKTFEEFILKYFAGTQAELDEMFFSFEDSFENLRGHMNEISIAMRRKIDLDNGKINAIDELFAAYSPSAHITDDFFTNKIAFVILLNFPLTTLSEKLKNGNKWTRREWAEVRLAQQFSKRIPANVYNEINKASTEADKYISEYNIYMHNIIDENGIRLFPKDMRLLSHWNLRDEIKSNYQNNINGIDKQRTIQKIMERIVNQTIPECVINNNAYDWDPFRNIVTTSKLLSEKNKVIDFKTEPNTRYLKLLQTFKASKKVDAFSPNAPTLVIRRFEEDREIPEKHVVEMLEEILKSPLKNKVAALIEKRLNRKLEPFDIWYNGFKTKSTYTEEQLNQIVRKKYTTAEAFQKDIPNLLIKIGFSKERSDFIANKIMIEPARGSGHAIGAAMRSEKARLRTRIAKTGMDYKAFNIAIHELGHNVEQTLSLYNIDNYFLNGVPNVAFTEAIAFYFQSQDLKLLELNTGLDENDDLKMLNDFWMTYEIAGVSMVDIEIWKWMYKNPKANPEQLKKAVITISKKVWNEYFASVFGIKDVILLGIYSHIIHSFLYIPDYAIGHIIAYQIKNYLNDKNNVGEEIERIVSFGCIVPDLWMENAVGNKIDAKTFLKSVEMVLDQTN